MSEERMELDNAEEMLEWFMSAWRQAKTAWGLGLGLWSYTSEFLNPFWISLNAFLMMERDKVLRLPPWETLNDFQELALFNQQIGEKGMASSHKWINRYMTDQAGGFTRAWLNTFFGGQGEGLPDFISRQSELLDLILYEYPQAIRDIKTEYGLHFDRDGYELAAETDHFELWRILPTEPGVEVDPRGKPVMIVHPYVLGPNILCFLPREKKSYVHAFANQGVPTYLRIVKDIDNTPAVQTMTGEDDAIGTRYLCELLKQRHGRPVTLNGFCQGGFITVLDLLTGELDGLVDALITCVAPMDGTRSQALVEYLEHLPPRFRDLGYALKTVPGGNKVVDGKVMSWVYKLKSMDKEAPVVTFFRDLIMFGKQGGTKPKIGKTAAAINHWLIYDRNDLPEGITRLSFDSYTIPVDDDGTLPIRLFGRKLNFNRIKERGLPWQICVAETDDLVDAPAALAPTDWVEAEVTVFPKGHGGIATSWSHPESKCALHTHFGQYRGPVRFHLDLP
jgi:hypothetical protein